MRSFVNFAFTACRVAALEVFVVCTGMAATPAPLHLVSVRDTAQSPPAGGSSDAWGPILSTDGRFVLFASTANNLVTLSGHDRPSGLDRPVFPPRGEPDGPVGKHDGLPLLNQPRLNVFLRDRANSTTTLVSVNLSGTGGGNGDSIPTGLSADGRYACFESSASDLVEGDTNGVTDVFVRDLASNLTVLVSVSLDGGAGNGPSRSSVMTPDGRYVAFVSSATNLVAGDTNGISDVFVRDLQAGLTALASPGAKSTTNLYSPIFGSSGSEGPDITPDGRHVAFYSTATNLVPGVSTPGEVYLRDLVAGTTTWVSSGARALLGTSRAVSYNQAVSADGQFVAFETSTNVGISTSPSARGLVLRYNTGTGFTDLVSTNANVQAADYKDARSLDITPDGRFLAFVANTNRLGTWVGTCIQLWDAQTGETLLVSGGPSDAVPQGSTCHWPAMDSVGRHVAFLSNARNLVPDSPAGEYHAYVRDVQAGTTTLVDASTNGLGTSLSPSTAPRLSADGGVVAFESPDSNLVPDDRNLAYDVFVRDLSVNSAELISARHPALPTLTPNGMSTIAFSCVSSDGRVIVFSSEADNLVADDTNGVRDIFVRDLFRGTNALVSIATNGGAADNISSQPAISADGRYVVFTSSADNLVPGDTNKAQDVFVRDLHADTTYLVSVNLAGTGPGKTDSYSPGISSDGTYVWFRSTATNLAAGSFGGTENLFLRDLPKGVTYALTTNGVLAASATPDGHLIAFSGQAGNLYLWDSLAGAIVYAIGTGPVSALGISPDGNRIVYGSTNGVAVIDHAAGTTRTIGGLISGSRSGLRFSRDSRFLTYASLFFNTNQVFLYDFETGTNRLISRIPFGAVGNDASDSPDISPDARFIAYRSFATNLLPDADNNGSPELLLYDSVTGSTTLLTRSRVRDGTPDNRSRTPVFSGNGHTLVFESWASDLVGRDCNQSADVFALSFLHVTLTHRGLGHHPTLSWFARPGERYRIEFTDNLSDPEWREVRRPVTIGDNQAQVTDLDPGPSQRFYRVVAY
jgi:Tol biopolymer transport system component